MEDGRTILETFHYKSQYRDIHHKYASDMGYMTYTYSTSLRIVSPIYGLKPFFVTTSS
jgi:hypothetical protein